MSAVTWKKLPPLDGRLNPCLCCPPIPAKLPLDAVIAVGFGDAHVSRDGEQVYREPSSYMGTMRCTDCDNAGDTTEAWKDSTLNCRTCEGSGRVDDPSAPPVEYWDVAEAEKLASADPDHDWRIVMFGPLHGEEYQRQGDNEWMLIEKSQGFA